MMSLFSSTTRNTEQDRIDLVDTMTALQAELDHHVEHAQTIARRLSLFERMKDSSAFRELCDLCADDNMREYFASTVEDDTEASKVRRIEMRAKAEAIKSLADMQETLTAERSLNNNRIVQTKLSIVETQNQLEVLINGRSDG